MIPLYPGDFILANLLLISLQRTCTLIPTQLEHPYAYVSSTQRGLWPKHGKETEIGTNVFWVQTRLKGLLYYIASLQCLQVGIRPSRSFSSFSSSSASPPPPLPPTPTSSPPPTPTPSSD